MFLSRPGSILSSVKERVYGNTGSPMFVFSPMSGLSDNEILFLSRWGIAESNRRLSPGHQRGTEGDGKRLSRREARQMVMDVSDARCIR
ncbi:unnamed protein product [Rangifer tarandus platyrhynchus]|uniref:Uncharacterized protein n=1 Tax=Rangifer tarandus platyrhynchus TaxID=3082113 RepID=A0AC59YIS0_RANTA